MNEGLIRWISGLSIVAALWLIFSPLWISYTSSGNAWAQVVIGVVVGLLAISRMSMPEVRWPSGVNFVAGLWFILAPWVISSTTAVKWNQVVLGVIVAGLAALDLSANPAPEEAAMGATGSSSRESMTFGERMPDRRGRDDSRR